LGKGAFLTKLVECYILEEMKIKQILLAPFKMVGKNFFPILIIGGLFFYIFDTDQALFSHKSGFIGMEKEIVQSASFESNSVDKVLSFSGAPMAKMSRRIVSPVPSVFADGGFAPEATNRKVIKEANLDLEVADSEEAKALAEAEVKSLDGFITNMNSWEVRVGVLAYRMTIRVPAEKLDIAMENLAKLGVKKSESFSSRDITAQYTDTEAQIKNLEARRTRLRKLLEFETKNLADVLQVDRELNNLQNQLDRLMRTQKGRDEKVAYSTLILTLNPKTQIGDLTNPEWNPEKSWKIAVNDLIKKSQHIIDRLIRLVVLAPIWLPVLFLLWLVKRRFWKK